MPVATDGVDLLLCAEEEIVHLQLLRGNASGRVLHGVTRLRPCAPARRGAESESHQESRMQPRSSPARSHDLRTWLLAAIVVAVLGLIAVVWDPRDLGDGLVLGSGGAVSTVWDTAQGEVDDLLFSVGRLPTRTAESGR